jgi:soluble lytic murein transglycosylase-like protein
MHWLAVLLLSQAPDPYEAMREAMEKSISRQRESVRQQAQAVHRFVQDEPDFFTVPWPRRMAEGGAAPVVSRGPICDPIPPAQLTPLVRAAAIKSGLPELLLDSVIWRESAARPCAVSAVGAMGLMQLMPDTAAQLGVQDPFDPRQSIDGGSRFLKDLLNRFGGDLTLALGAYNAGPHRIEQYGGLPPFAETQNYVHSILTRLGMAHGGDD